MRPAVRSWGLAHAAPSPGCAAAADRAATSRAATASAIGYLHAAANVFLIEDVERGETDVGHFLAKNEALIARGNVRLRDIGGGHRGCRVASSVSSCENAWHACARRNRRAKGTCAIK